MDRSPRTGSPASPGPRAPFVVALGLGLPFACADNHGGAGAQTPSAGAQAPAVTPEPSPPASPEPASSELASPEPPPPEPPSPEPARVTAPDGTEMAACATAPRGMACVDGGPFTRGSDDGPEDTRPAEQIWLQTFYMDTHEVTIAEYKACKKTKQCPRGGPLYNDFSRARQPIVGPNWYAAVKYCKAQGKHLPTEAEWEKAARGPDGALYPWGDEVATCDRAIIKDRRGRSCGVPKRFEHPKKGRTYEVGSRAPGVYGLYDMSGNAWEWVADWYSKDYASCGDDCRGVNPRGPCGGQEPCKGYDQKVVRGGSWYWDASYATAIYRRSHYPINEHSNFHHFGFRCAASIDEAAALVDAGVVAAEGEEPPRSADAKLGLP